MNMKMDMKMQTHSLTVCGAYGKAVILQLLWYIRCDTHLSQRIKVKKVQQYLHVFKQLFRFFMRQHQIQEYRVLSFSKILYFYRLFQSSVCKFHQIIVLRNNKCSVHLNESVNIIGWLVFFAFL